MTQLLNELREFTGSEIFYRNPLFRKYCYTQGVKYLAEKAGAYWLIDLIFAHQHDKAIAGLEFQVWKIGVATDQSAIIRVEDGDMKHIISFDVPFTDFPLKEFSLWFTDNTLLLPSEY